MPTPIKLPALVSEVIEHQPDLRSYILTPEKPVPRFRPGQFLHLAIDPYDPARHWPESRAFSIASSPMDRTKLKITVSRKGGFTTRMFDQLSPQARVWIKLPYGSFTPNISEGHEIIMLAGGTGVTPFVSFIEWAAHENITTHTIQLHYAVRSPELLIYRDQLQACKNKLASLSLTFYAEELNDYQATDLKAGRISIPVLWNALKAPNSTHVYLSGPQEMINVFRQQFLGLGASNNNIFIDEWS
jgi:ferredoxin-NADP reductase